jgi:glycine betaine/proline transport system substrate-binding protein
MEKKIKAVVLGILLVFVIAAAGCADQTEDTPTNETTAGDTNEQAETVTIGYVLWDGEIASTNVMQQVLEQAGYDVEITAVDAGALYQGLADSQFDFTTSAWLPVTQANYWDKYGDQIDSVAVNLEGCKLGLAVPTYVTIDSIEELNENKEQFSGEIIGIDPGAGIMQNTEEAIEAYDLDYELVASSSAGMTAELSSAVNDGDWIVVTLWSPHWAFGRFDLKYLEDPEGVYGQADHVETLARLGLEEDKPGLYGIISRFYWEQDDIQSIMMDIENGTSPEDAASKWIEANPETVNEWIGDSE